MINTHKIKANQSGFSIVEATMILAILAIIGFIGWYVWQNKTRLQSASIPAISSTKAKSPTKIKTSQDQITPARYLKFDNYEIFYTPPAQWAVKETPATTTNGIESASVTFSSPDYKFESGPSNGRDCGATVSGKSIKLYITSYPGEPIDDYINSILSPPQNDISASLLKNAALSTISGQKAVQYLSTTGECN